MNRWPITLLEVLEARRRIRAHMQPSPLRRYGPLDELVGSGIRTFIKHENHLPTNSFKARNALSALTALSPSNRVRGVIAATRGNHGAGLAWAGEQLGIPVTIVVPVGNNPEKNASMRSHGAELIETGRDYDEAVEVAARLSQERGLVAIHSTNNVDVIAGAATIALEMLEDQPDLDAMVLPVGGGSQAVGALTVVKQLKPQLKVYAVQAAEASAIHDSWHARRPMTKSAANTFADGMATRATYPLTFGALLEGLSGFVTATEAELAEALRSLLRTTHNLAEGAGAAGLAGLLKLRGELAGKRVGIVLSGSNIDQQTLRRVVANEL